MEMEKNDTSKTYTMYDIIFVKSQINENNTHIQLKDRPCIVCQNPIGCAFAPTLIVMALTSRIKKLHMPTHEIIRKNCENGLLMDSMILGEQIFTINKDDVLCKIGEIISDEDKAKVQKCYLANFFGSKVNQMICA